MTAFSLPNIIRGISIPILNPRSSKFIISLSEEKSGTKTISQSISSCGRSQLVILALIFSLFSALYGVPLSGLSGVNGLSGTAPYCSVRLFRHSRRIALIDDSEKARPLSMSILISLIANGVPPVFFNCVKAFSSLNSTLTAFSGISPSDSAK